MVLERNIQLAEYKGTSMQKMSCQQLTEETAVGTYREFVIFDDECVCVSWVYVTVCPCDVDSQRHRVFTWMLRTGWLKPKLAASTRIWWRGQILGCCENVLLSPLLVLQIPGIFRRSSGLVKPPSTISNQSPCNHYLILLALLMGMFPTCVLKCVKGFQEWTIASPRKSGSFGGISGHVAPLCPHQPAV